MPLTRSAFALLLALVASPVLAADEAPLYRDIKDWLVGCDNTRACTAIAAVQARDDTGTDTYSLRVTREAGPGGELRVGLFSYNPPTGQPLLDGQPLSIRLGPGRPDTGDVGEVFAVQGDSAQRLLAELRNGKQLSLPVADGVVVASLSGMSAALLLMDSVQGRIGSTTALLRQGPAPAASVPTAPAPPSLPAWQAPAPLSPADSQRLLDTVMATTRAQWQAEVYEDSPPEGKAFALTTNQALVIIKTGCAAYNCTYSLYQVPLAHPDQARPINMAEMSRWPDLQPTGEVDFDPVTGELSSLQLAMGMGGCGTSARWRYDGERFRLTHLAQMGVCMGLNEAQWPVLWRTVDAP
ncbi:DUF1176 domain-containing protein [Pseudomonas sp. DTU_2021_1001937_2_SI_NGA_ILE_001]|uniref:DUF1176 domain-containing protein n=1 Tax=Pseudomonas sp. DTU_2021_1001937_2_SI_NGA_ILE_001 TaxID=3077589 RepID=UPI00397C500F